MKFPVLSRPTVIVDLAIIIAVVALLYGHTLQVPLYLDDKGGLIDNYPLRDLPAAFCNIFSQRGLTNLTFALNYRLTGWSLPPLHLVNIVLHAGCGVMGWLLLKRLLGNGRWLPLLGALLFIAHPLQTQGVTYLVQRSTVLATCLSLLAVFCHLQARSALEAGCPRNTPEYLRPYVGAILAALGAMLAKEQTVILPLLLAAYDRLFPLTVGRSSRQFLLDYLPYLVVVLLLTFELATLWLPEQEGPRRMTTALASLEGNDPLHYLFTQFSVLWIYLRLLLLPYGQALEHNYPIVQEFLSLPNLLALAGWLVVAWLVWRLRRRYPLAVFGVVWFFLGLSVESSIIPLDPMFEHRLHLPMFGFVLLLVDRLPALAGSRWGAGILVALLLLWAPLTWRRNALWNDPVAFYQENLRLSPSSERVVKALAALYDRAGERETTYRLLEQTVADYPRSFFLYPPLARRRAARGDWAGAFSLLETGMQLQPGYADLYEMAATLCKEQGDPQRAADYLLRGLAVPGADQRRLLNSLGVLYSDFGVRPDAENTFLASLSWPMGDAYRAVVQANLAREYFYQGRWSDAAAMLRTVVELTPGDPVALEKLGEVSLRLGDVATARWAAGKLKHADPQGWLRLQAAITSAGG